MTWGQKPCFKVIEGKLRKKSCAHSIAPDIPMSLLERKSCSAKASTIFESHFHGAKVVCPICFCAICRPIFSLRLLTPESKFLFTGQSIYSELNQKISLSRQFRGVFYEDKIHCLRNLRHKGSPACLRFRQQLVYRNIAPSARDII